MTDVQPTGDVAAGQGTESQGGLFDSYLQAVPEDAREYVTGYLKDAEKNVNTKLREAADIQQRFGDYKDIDLSRLQPEQLSQVIDWYSQVGQSPEAYQEWLKEAATEAGLIEKQEEPAQDQDIEAYIQSRISQALQPIQDRLSKNDEATQTQAMERHIVSTLDKIESDNKIQLNDEQREAILALGEQVSGDDWVEKGWAKFQALTGQAQANLVKEKTNQPPVSLRTGGSAAASKPKTFADVREAALELMQSAV